MTPAYFSRHADGFREHYLRNEVISQRGAALLLFVGIEQRPLPHPNRQDQRGDPVPKAAGPTGGKNAPEGIPAPRDQYLILPDLSCYSRTEQIDLRTSPLFENRDGSIDIVLKHLWHCSFRGQLLFHL
jgi:hypothetical protein